MKLKPKNRIYKRLLFLNFTSVQRDTLCDVQILRIYFAFFVCAVRSFVFFWRISIVFAVLMCSNSNEFYIHIHLFCVCIQSKRCGLNANPCLTIICMMSPYTTPNVFYSSYRCTRRFAVALCILNEFLIHSCETK